MAHMGDGRALMVFLGALAGWAMFVALDCDNWGTVVWAALTGAVWGFTVIRAAVRSSVVGAAEGRD